MRVPHNEVHSAVPGVSCSCYEHLCGCWAFSAVGADGLPKCAELVSEYPLPWWMLQNQGSFP